MQKNTKKCRISFAELVSFIKTASNCRPTINLIFFSYFSSPFQKHHSKNKKQYYILNKCMVYIVHIQPLLEFVMLSIILNISITETMSKSCRYMKAVRRETFYKICVLRQFIDLCSVDVVQQVLLTFVQIASFVVSSTSSTNATILAQC